MRNDELITNWGLVIEGFFATQKVLADDIESGSGLSVAWFAVLLRLVRTPGHRLPMTQLAHHVDFSSGGFTKLADRIQEAGYVERISCPDDRRVTWMGLTPAGEAVITAAMTRHVEHLRSVLVAPLGEGLVDELGQSMRILRDTHT